MMRILVGALILMSAAVARAEDCYYFWTHQCVEVIDASKRQLKQSVLISPSINYFHSPEQSCDTSATERQDSVMAPLLEAFNAKADKIKACSAPLSEVSMRVFNNPQKATWHYNRSTRATDSKTVITVDNLPLL